MYYYVLVTVTFAILCYDFVIQTSHVDKDRKSIIEFDTVDSNDPIKDNSHVNDRSKKDDSEKEYSKEYVCII